MGTARIDHKAWSVLNDCSTHNFGDLVLNQMLIRLAKIETHLQEDDSETKHCKWHGDKHCSLDLAADQHDDSAGYAKCAPKYDESEPDCHKYSDEPMKAEHS